jgi:SAM-dependent methyltransferase
MKNTDLRQDFLDETVTEDVVWSYYREVAGEINESHLDETDQAHFRDYYTEAGLLRPWRIEFFRRHYAAPFAKALNFILPHEARETCVVDLGCGTGTQTIAFAARGARVLAVDLNSQALRIVEKRKEFWERKLNRKLDIQIVNANALEFDFVGSGPIDGVYSMFAFNLIQPTRALLTHLRPSFSERFRIAVQDGNRASWIAQLPGRRRSHLSPPELNSVFNEFGLNPIHLRGAVSVPPILWSVLPRQFLVKCDDILNKSWKFALSYLALYARV